MNYDIKKINDEYNSALMAVKYTKGFIRKTVCENFKDDICNFYKEHYVEEKGLHTNIEPDKLFTTGSISVDVDIVECIVRITHHQYYDNSCYNTPICLIKFDDMLDTDDVLNFTFIGVE